MQLPDILSDSFLLEELKKRLDEKNKLLNTQSALVLELEELNDRLRDVEQMKSGFLSNIRNEINNPLTSILGLSGQMIHGPAMDVEKIMRVANLINKEAFSLDFQLRNIFSAAEIEAGEINPQPSAVNVDDLIANQIQYFHFKAIQHNIQVTYQGGQGRHFKTDGAILHSVVMNLLANAIEFSLEGKQVNIQCTISDNVLTIGVQDFGKGIDPKDRKHIFERFRQLDSGTTKTHQGHGLGLSIVKEFTDALRGKIEIDSEIGKQTTITITLNLK
jgi:two-component system, OmpR family, phosphate regulon sensor histidine kinase PhoR